MRLSTLLFVIVLFAGFAGILSGNIALAVTPTISINNVSVSEGDSGTAATDMASCRGTKGETRLWVHSRARFAEPHA